MSEGKNNEGIAGFIVHASYDSGRDGTRIFLVGRLENGETFAAVFPGVRPGFYVRKNDEIKASPDIQGAMKEETHRHTMDGEAVFHLSWGQVSEMQRHAESLMRADVRTYEADLRIYDQMLIDRGIFGALQLAGDYSEGRHVDRVYINPPIVRYDGLPSLSVCSIDIENNPDTREILSIALAHSDPFSHELKEEVLFSGPNPGMDSVTPCLNERDVLMKFSDRITEFDPDIMTGWNCTEYDFEVIAERLGIHGLEMRFGRSDRPGAYMPGDRAQSSAVIIPGRQVVDAMRVIRSGPVKFFDNSLDTVARSVLGEGKIELGESKVEAIMQNYRNDPRRFCEYNLRDAKLVLDILEATGMLDLTIRRASLTGMALSRAWTSVAAFERVYIGRMHELDIVAPTHGVDVHRIGRAPGGAIIPPQPGIHDDVLVFDFKSLYPSIMRTFNIDPVAYIPPETLDAPDDVVEAPNGAAFRRDIAILPDILARFFQRREEAKRDNDEAASYVYKIIMNSFYGVLGTTGCRFAASDIAGAITGFGHEFLSWCRKHFESLGYHVLYGDTDSLFIQLRTGIHDPVELTRLGREIASETTKVLAKHIESRWKVPSYLELEFEQLYQRFFLPALRGAAGHSSMREVDVAALQGRAKGYAGLRYDPGGRGPAESRIDVKGMEAVRRDWTEAAKKLQRELLKMVFERAAVDHIESYIATVRDELASGSMDADLVYHKALRKSVDSYARNKPPHVRAAMLLPPADRRGVISYFWTVDGPEPVKRVSHTLDYKHYMDKQLRPIAEGIGDVMGHDFTRIFENDPQTELF